MSLLATQATVNAKRYQSWSTKVEAIACPKLVPLVEANKIDEAKQEFVSYLDMINNKKAPVILLYSLPILKSSLTEFEFIDPAELLLIMPVRNINSSEVLSLIIDRIFQLSGSSNS